ncbi:MAG: hypothetical protein JRI81_07385 [Deltaproteobacteria bacterium]|nr:hypothetical protein [Deltaproteobacteria bacterium]
MKERVTDVANRVVQISRARLESLVRKGFRNWKTQFHEDFDIHTKPSNLSTKTLIQLAAGKENSSFYLFDLIMNLLDFGSGFEFNSLQSAKKMAVMDRYLFLLDQIRFEYLKRLGWLDSYPGEEYSIVDLVIHFEDLAPRIQATTPLLGSKHPEFEEFCNMNAFQKEEFLRSLISRALKQIQDHSTTL